jgi:hypothetical protein
MTRILSSTLAAALAAAAMQTTPALAQRVFVAAEGSDANPCTFAAPCRTFQHAHDTVAAGGEIDVLDPAGYGALRISKAISIQGHGFAGISFGHNQSGIDVGAGAADSVSVNGLIIDGSGVGAIGIDFATGAGLIVRNCVIRNVTSVGLQFLTQGTTSQSLSVSRTYFTDLGRDGVAIISLGSGSTVASIERSAIYGAGIGASLRVDGSGGTGPIDVALADSVVAHDSGSGTARFGVEVESGAGHSATTLTATRLTAVGNGVGVLAAGANASLRLSQSTITGNATGFAVSAGAAIFSYGDNVIAGNGSNTGALSSVALQ